MLTRTVKVPPRTSTAEIQPVTFEDMSELAADDISQDLDFNIAQEDLTKEQFLNAKKFITSNRDIPEMYFL